MSSSAAQPHPQPHTHAEGKRSLGRKEKHKMSQLPPEITNHILGLSFFNCRVGIFPVFQDMHLGWTGSWQKLSVGSITCWNAGVGLATLIHSCSEGVAVLPTLGVVLHRSLMQADPVL